MTPQYSASMPKAAKRTFDAMSGLPSTSSSGMSSAAHDDDKYEALLQDTKLLMAEIKQLRTQNKLLVAESNNSTLEIRRLNKLLKDELNASESLRKKLKESQLNSGKF